MGTVAAPRPRQPWPRRRRPNMQFSIDPNNEYARAYLAFVLWMSGDHEGAYAEARAAYDLNPVNAMALAALGVVNAFSGPGGYEPAVEYLERAMRVSPQDPNFSSGT